MRISDWSSDVCSSDLADLAEQAFHAEGARLVGDDRHQPRADLLVPECNVEHLHAGHGGADLALAGVLEPALVGFQRLDRNSVVWGKRVSGRVDLVGRGNINIKKP